MPRRPKRTEPMAGRAAGRDWLAEVRRQRRARERRADLLAWLALSLVAVAVWMALPAPA